MSANKLREDEERVLHTGPDRETVVNEALTTPIQQSLPVTWRDEAGKTHLQGTNALVKATDQDVAQFGFAPTRVCGTCRYFELEKGRQEMVRQRFSERLVHDYQWKRKYLGTPLSHVGLCGASGGEKATTSISNAGRCDQYRPIRFSEPRRA